MKSVTKSKSEMKDDHYQLHREYVHIETACTLSLSKFEVASSSEKSDGELLVSRIARMRVSWNMEDKKNSKEVGKDT